MIEGGNMIDKMQIWPWKKPEPEKPQTIADMGAKIVDNMERSAEHSRSAARTFSAVSADLDAWTRGKA
jgi:hypothetical protein